MEILYTSIAGIFTTAISGIISWFMAKKKYYSEVDNQTIKNMISSLEFYKTLSDDNLHRLKEQIERNDRLEILVSDLLKQINELRNQLIVMMELVCLLVTCNKRVRTTKTA